MADVGFVAVLIAFFALATLLARGCERIIGPDESGVADEPPSRESVAA